MHPRESSSPLPVRPLLDFGPPPSPYASLPYRPVASPGTAQHTRSRLWAAACHLSALLGLVVPFGHLIFPFIVWRIARRPGAGGEYANAHGRDALNFNITITALLAGALLLIFLLIGLALIPFILLFWFACTAIAATDALAGDFFDLPYIIRLF